MSTPFDRRILWVHREGDTSRDLVENIKQATPNAAGVILVYDRAGSDTPVGHGAGRTRP